MPCTKISHMMDKFGDMCCTGHELMSFPIDRNNDTSHAQVPDTYKANGDLVLTNGSSMAAASRAVLSIAGLL